MPCTLPSFFIWCPHEALLRRIAEGETAGANRVRTVPHHNDRWLGGGGPSFALSHRAASYKSRLPSVGTELKRVVGPGGGTGPVREESVSLTGPAEG